jgi:hypothetical protein
MNSIIDEYNSSKHSSIKKAPDNFKPIDETDWMNKKMNETYQKELVGLPESSMVKILNEGAFAKKRLNYSRDSYKINSRDGHQYIVEAKDNSVGRYPCYKLITTTTHTKKADNLNDDRYGIVDKITDYTPKRNKYKLIYEGGVEDEVFPKILRKGNPTRLSIAEAKYWNQNGGKNKLPDEMKQLA